MKSKAHAHLGGIMDFHLCARGRLFLVRAATTSSMTRITSTELWVCISQSSWRVPNIEVSYLCLGCLLNSVRLWDVSHVKISGLTRENTLVRFLSSIAVCDMVVVFHRYSVQVEVRVSRHVTV